MSTGHIGLNAADASIDSVVCHMESNTGLNAANATPNMDMDISTNNANANASIDFLLGHAEGNTGRNAVNATPNMDKNNTEDASPNIANADFSIATVLRHTEGNNGLNAADATLNICQPCNSELHNSDTSCTNLILKNLRKRRKHIVTEHVDSTLVKDHDCVRNYDGSSGGMESDGLILILKESYEKYGNNIFVETVVTDDDTKIKKYLTYPKYKDRGWKTHGGCLPLHITESSQFVDPTHLEKCVAGDFLT